MNPVTAALVSGALIIAGKWSRGQAPNIDNAVGIAGIALGLALLNQLNPRLSKAFAALIVISLAVVHFPTIAESAGLTPKSSKGVGRAQLPNLGGGSGSGNRPR